MKKNIDKRIAQLYRERCSGIEIDIMDVTKVHAVGVRLIAADPNVSDEVLGDGIRAFVETVRKN